MEKLITTLTFCLFFLVSVTATDNEDLKGDFKWGNPQIQSISALEFGPDGILFLGDAQSAKVFAIDAKAEGPAAEVAPMEDVDVAIANQLGTPVDNISITDMAIDPESKKVYFSVHHTDGTPVLMSLSGDQWGMVDLANLSYSVASISQPIGTDAKDRRGRSLRKWAISDLSFYNGQVMVSGLSNQEFGSTFRSLPFPFTEVQRQSSLEIYHAAHGKYETHAPIKAFTAAKVGGEDHLIASYTCTPLVVFPLNELKQGEHVKGRTVAELGNWNTPLDMIVMEKEGNQYLLMANSSRAVMKIKFEDIESFKSALTTRVEERSGTAGVDFIALPFVNVLQLDKIDESNFAMLQRTAAGKLNLTMQGDRWL
ncbi:MAG: hypothetical protein AAGA85_10055 [Bacteroidota bacterium]